MILIANMNSKGANRMYTHSLGSKVQVNNVLNIPTELSEEVSGF